jgi:hypothetical protein
VVTTVPTESRKLVFVDDSVTSLVQHHRVAQDYVRLVTIALKDRYQREPIVALREDMVSKLLV